MDGFIPFDSRIHTSEQNVLTYRNIVSPFCDLSQINNEHSEGKAYIDENYGLVYDDYYLAKDAFIYGQVDKIPEYSGDHLANQGFLRVPFRKIPKILVNNRAELMAILSGIESRDPDLVVLYRGQFSEHPIKRDKETLYRLYGDENAQEPSLVTSAARKNLRLEDILPSWMAIINLYIEGVMARMPEGERKNIERSIINFQSSSNCNAFGLALAQHYGLPSVGLDVTPDIDVALFFALRKYVDSDTPFHHAYQDIKEIKPTAPPVIYLVAPTEDQQLDYFKMRPSILPFLRPDKQAARFMHTGWGLNKNFAATKIFLAIYLNPEGDYGEIKQAAELFPPNDSFAKLIDYIRINQKHDDPLLTKFLENFYIIK